MIFRIILGMGGWMASKVISWNINMDREFLLGTINTAISGSKIGRVKKVEL